MALKSSASFQVSCNIVCFRRLTVYGSSANRCLKTVSLCLVASTGRIIRSIRSLSSFLVWKSLILACLRSSTRCSGSHTTLTGSLLNWTRISPDLSTLGTLLHRLLISDSISGVQLFPGSGASLLPVPQHRSLPAVAVLKLISVGSESFTPVVLDSLSLDLTTLEGLIDIASLEELTSPISHESSWLVLLQPPCCWGEGRSGEGCGGGGRAALTSMQAIPTIIGEPIWWPLKVGWPG